MVLSWFRKLPAIATLSPEELKARLENKNVVIVGGTAGIGRALSIACLNRGANVSIVGRRQPDEKLRRANFIQADLSLMSSAVALVEENSNRFAESDIVVFTNGIIAFPERKVTPEGLEVDLAVSYLSRFAIVDRMLQPDIQFGLTRSDKETKPRIFVMGYPGQNVTVNLDDFNSEKKYAPIEAHMRTVVGNEALVSHLATIGAKNEEPFHAFGLNPGLIKTEIRNNYLGQGTWFSSIVETLIGWFYQSADSYAEKVLIHLLVTPELEPETANGTLYDASGRILKANPFLTMDDNLANLLKISQELLTKARGSSSTPQ